MTIENNRPLSINEETKKSILNSQAMLLKKICPQMFMNEKEYSEWLKDLPPMAHANFDTVTFDNYKGE